MCLPFDSISVQCVCHACHLASVCQFFYLFPFDSITQTMYERCFILSTLFLVRVIMIIYIERYPSSCVCVHCVCVSVCLCSVQPFYVHFFLQKKLDVCFEYFANFQEFTASMGRIGTIKPSMNTMCKCFSSGTEFYSAQTQTQTHKYIYIHDHQCDLAPFKASEAICSTYRSGNCSNDTGNAKKIKTEHKNQEHIN